MRKPLLFFVLAACFCGAGIALSEIPATSCLYLPPSFSDRVVFYDAFESPEGVPEIDRIHAQLTGAQPMVEDGFAGLGCRSADARQQEKPFQISSPSISASRPLTVMRSWRIDAPMVETSSFQLMALLGPTGHISCFVHGAGEWCALKRPTMFVQIDSFPKIANINQWVVDNAYYKPGEWHHIAATIASASDVRFYLDGRPLVTLQASGRPFNARDIDTIQPAAQSNLYDQLPMTSDDVMVIDRVLNAEEIQQYWLSVQKLKQMQFPALLSPNSTTRPHPTTE